MKKKKYTLGGSLNFQFSSQNAYSMNTLKIPLVILHAADFFLLNTKWNFSGISVEINSDNENFRLYNTLEY